MPALVATVDTPGSANALHFKEGYAYVADGASGLQVVRTNCAFLSIQQPNGGESWLKGSTQSIIWSRSGVTGTATIDLHKAGVFQQRIANLPGTDCDCMTLLI